MMYWRSLTSIPKDLKATVITIGSFDGIHLGHQEIVNRLLQEAAREQLTSVVISFNPYPKEFFSKERLPRLMSWREKFCALNGLGADYFLTIPFNQALADMSAHDFVKDILVDRLKARVIIIGDDFRFGKNRQGDYDFLTHLSSDYGFLVIQMPTFNYDDSRVSSSRVRAKLQSGDMAIAKELLGHYYYLCGTVVHGDKLGRQLGFPTANIDLHRRSVPLHGIYVVRVSGIDDVIYDGVANIGTRPAVQGSRVLLEVYLFNFNREIYGANIKVEFLHKLRDEAHYANLDLLVDQIRKDVIDAKLFIASSSFLPHA